LEEKLLEQQQKEMEYKNKLSEKDTLTTNITENNLFTQKLKDEINSLQEELKKLQLSNIESTRYISSFNERELLKQREIDQIIINKTAIEQQLIQAQKKSNELEASQVRVLAEVEDKNNVIEKLQKQAKELEIQNSQLQALANKSTNDTNEPNKQSALKRSVSSPAKEITWQASKNKSPTAFDNLHNALKIELANGEDPLSNTEELEITTPPKRQSKKTKKEPELPLIMEQTHLPNRESGCCTTCSIM